MLRCGALKLLASYATFGGIHSVAEQTPSNAHTAWVVESLKRMGAIRPGETREALLQIFTTEGGLSTGLHRTYVYRDCPYFKVDVDFRPVGRPERDADGRVTLVEDERDVITNISRPYLEFSVID